MTEALPFRTVGDGPPLLLIHGNRDHAHNWDWTAARLQDRYHIVAPDLRGHGDSQWSAGSMYAPAEFVYDIAQLVHQRLVVHVRVFEFDGLVGKLIVGVASFVADVEAAQFAVLEVFAGRLRENRGFC